MTDITIIRNSITELEALALAKADAAENFATAIKEVAKKASANKSALAKLVAARIKGAGKPESLRDESEEVIGLLDALED